MRRDINAIFGEAAPSFREIEEVKLTGLAVRRPTICYQYLQYI